MLSIKNNYGILIKKYFINLCVKFSAAFLVDQLYQGILSRKAEKIELLKSILLIHNKKQLKPLIKKLKDSDEFKVISFNAVVPEIVKASYNGILNRDPDEQDLKKYIGKLRKNGDTAGFIRSIIKSSNHRASSNSVFFPSLQIETAEFQKPTKGRLIIVSSNCQTGGITATLQACFPGDRVVPLPLPNTSSLEVVHHFIGLLKNADVWVSLYDTAWATSNGFRPSPSFQHVKIPSIFFPAFHPDLCYAKNSKNFKFTTEHYNSAIAVWGYNQGLTPSATKLLFNRENYGNLGYFDFWDPSVESLRKSFAECELDFSRFMLAIKRTGLFMHSINHPMIHALIELAKLVSLKIGGAETIWVKNVKIKDALMSEVDWPFYPEIADEFSLSFGSYDWKVRDLNFQGVEPYLEHTFRRYESQQIQRGFLKIENRDEKIYDRVLGPQADLL